MLIAGVGLLSAVLGGVIQAIFARSFERARFERQAKWDLYTQYFLVLGELTFSDEGSDRHKNALSLMAQLRGRIGIVGSPGVIRAVGAVFRYSNLSSSDAQTAMAVALEAMRADVGNRGPITQADFVQLMFGNRDASK